MAALVAVPRGKPLLHSTRGLPADLPLASLLLLAPEPKADGICGIRDTAAHRRMARHPLVAGRPFIRSAALARLDLALDAMPGVLLVADTVPKSATKQELRALRELARLAAHTLEQGCVRRAEPIAAAAAAAGVQRLNQLVKTLRLQQQRLADFVAAATDVMWETDQNLVMAAGEGPRSVTGRGFEQVGGVNIFDTLEPAEMARAQFVELWQALAARLPFRGIEFCRRQPDGTEIWLEINGVPYFSQSCAFLGYRGITRNITRRKLAEQQIQRMAREDDLTGLPNRRAFRATLERALLTSLTPGHCVALMMLDLDGFKRVNDTLGHDAGDAVLVETAARLGRCLCPGGHVARYGGDEFAILLRDAGREALERLLRRLVDALGEPIVCAGTNAHVSACIGIAMLPEDACTPEAALKAADLALYAAKHRSRGSWCFHTDMTAAHL